MTGTTLPLETNPPAKAREDDVSFFEEKSDIFPGYWLLTTGSCFIARVPIEEGLDRHTPYWAELVKLRRNSPVRGAA